MTIKLWILGCAAQLSTIIKLSVLHGKTSNSAHAATLWRVLQSSSFKWLLIKGQVFDSWKNTLFSKTFISDWELYSRELDKIISNVVVLDFSAKYFKVTLFIQRKTWYNLLSDGSFQMHWLELSDRRNMQNSIKVH